MELTNENMTPDNAVYLADSVFPYLKESDIIIYDKIYSYV